MLRFVYGPLYCCLRHQDSFHGRPNYGTNAVAPSRARSCRFGPLLLLTKQYVSLKASPVFTCLQILYRSSPNPSLMKIVVVDVWFVLAESQAGEPSYTANISVRYSTIFPIGGSILHKCGINARYVAFSFISYFLTGSRQPLIYILDYRTHTWFQTPCVSSWVTLVHKDLKLTTHSTQLHLRDWDLLGHFICIAGETIDITYIRNLGEITTEQIIGFIPGTGLTPHAPQLSRSASLRHPIPDPALYRPEPGVIPSTPTIIDTMSFPSTHAHFYGVREFALTRSSFDVHLDTNLRIDRNEESGSPSFIVSVKSRPGDKHYLVASHTPASSSVHMAGPTVWYMYDAWAGDILSGRWDESEISRWPRTWSANQTNQGRLGGFNVCLPSADTIAGCILRQRQGAGECSVDWLI